MDVEFQAARTQSLSNTTIWEVSANLSPMEVAHAVAYKNALSITPGINREV